MATKTKLASVLRGDTISFQLTFTDAQSQAINVASTELYFTLKATKDNDLTDASAALKHDETLPDDANTQAGIASFVVPATKVDAVTPGTYFYDLQWIQPGAPDQVQTLIYGTVGILTDITRRTTVGA